MITYPLKANITLSIPNESESVGYEVAEVLLEECASVLDDLVQNGKHSLRLYLQAIIDSEAPNSGIRIIQNAVFETARKPYRLKAGEVDKFADIRENYIPDWD